MKKRPLILFSVPALRQKDLKKLPLLSSKLKLDGVFSLSPSVPALTCSVQANLTTGTAPNEHGIVGNGFLISKSTVFESSGSESASLKSENSGSSSLKSESLKSGTVDCRNINDFPFPKTEKMPYIEFWTFPNKAILRPQIWDVLKKKNPKCKALAWFPLQVKGIKADFACTFAPIHQPDGTESLWCYTEPRELYGKLKDRLGHFPVQHYWGPLAGMPASQWILQSLLETLKLIANQNLLPKESISNFSSTKKNAELSDQFKLNEAKSDKNESNHSKHNHTNLNKTANIQISSRQPELYETKLNQSAPDKISTDKTSTDNISTNNTSTDEMFTDNTSTDKTLAELPDFLFVYVPLLDYVPQKFGPNSPEFDQVLEDFDPLVFSFMSELESIYQTEADWLFCGEYAMTDVDSVVFPNRILRELGLFEVEQREGKEYPDLIHSKAIAVCDHQISHLYFMNEENEQKKQQLIEKTAEKFRSLPEIETVLSDKDDIEKYSLDSTRSGDIVLFSRRNSWQAYYYWFDNAAAPDFARTVDIHRKPGYDPVELFWDRETKSVPLDVSLVKGSHGIPPVDADQKSALFCSDNQMKTWFDKRQKQNGQIRDTDVFAAILDYFSLK